MDVQALPFPSKAFSPVVEMYCQCGGLTSRQTLSVLRTLMVMQHQLRMARSTVEELPGNG